MGKQLFTPEETRTLLKPADLNLTYTSFQTIPVEGTVTVASGQEELCIIVVEGEVDFACGTAAGHAVLNDTLYLPIEESVTLSGKGLVVRYGAPCARKTRFAHIKFAEVNADERHKHYGTPESGCSRDVWNIIDEKFDSSRFLVGICYGAPGGWTAWPPHEHGEKREEVYYYYNMGDGFGIQCVYTDMQQPDVVAMVQNGTFITIPQGYHPNTGCPKTGIRYIYCMVSVTAEDRNFMDLNTQKIYGDHL